MINILEEALKVRTQEIKLRMWKDKFGWYSGYNFNIRNIAHHLQLEEQPRLETCFSIHSLKLATRENKMCQRDRTVIIHPLVQ